MRVGPVVRIDPEEEGWLDGSPRFVALFGIAALLATAAGAATYPIPPFNFAHPGTPHPDDDPVGDPLLSTASGDDDRPLVVVLGRGSDVTDPAGATSASIQTMFFGGFASVTDFFDARLVRPVHGLAGGRDGGHGERRRDRGRPRAAPRLQRR